MKKVILLVLPILIIFGACSKYEDGPKLSLNTKKHRLVNSWVIEKAFEGGVDYTTDYKNTYVSFVLIMKKDGTYNLSYVLNNISPYNETGDWRWTNDKSGVSFFNSANYNYGLGDRWTITRLKEKELWFKYYNSNGTVTELHLIEQ